MTDEPDLTAIREFISDYPEDSARTIYELQKERARLIRERDEARALLREARDELMRQYDPEDAMAMIRRIYAALEGR